MADTLKIGGVLMAAGSGKRFGSNKLASEFRGQSLFLHALNAIPVHELDSVAVVTQYPEFAESVKEYRFAVIFNDSPESGQSHTLHLGVQALQHCDGILFQVADQPLLRRESVAALIQLWRTQPDKIAALAHGGKRGNPCLFPARFYPELLAITGDRGGSAVIRNHPEELLLLEVAEEELLDVDTVEALNELKHL